MNAQEISVLPVGDSAVTVQFTQVIEESVNRQVHALAHRLAELAPAGLRETIPAFCSLMVCYDPLKLSFAQVKNILTPLLADLAAENTAPRRVIEIPVCYGGAHGEDLADVAALAGLTEAEVIQLHSQPEYLIYMLGFLPGFAYLGGLPEQIAVPRLQTPRLKIAPGAVGIGGNQTGIYPLTSPGGWRIIGRTPVLPYQPDRNPPILYQAGDYLRFVPISAAEFRRLAAENEQEVQ